MEDFEICKLMSKNWNNNILDVVSFSNSAIKVSCNKKMQYQAYQRSEEDSIKKILVANTGIVEYVGNNYGQDAKERNEFCRFLIGKLSKKSGIMRIYAVELFLCKPLLTIPDENLSATEEKSYMEKVHELTGAFGSKCTIKAMELRREIALETEALEASAADVQEAVIEEDLYIPETTQVSASQQELIEKIPPQNRNATSPEEVYNLNDIISEEEYASIGKEANILIEANIDDINMWKEDQRYESYVMQHYQFQEMKKVNLLAHYNLMVHMAKLKAKDLNCKDPMPSIPEPFKQNLLNRFTVTSLNKSGKTYRSKMQNKLLAYILVVALFIDDFRINLCHIHSDFTGRISLKRFIEIAHALGCHVNTKTNIAVLNIPLYIPTGAGYSSGARPKV